MIDHEFTGVRFANGTYAIHKDNLPLKVRAVKKVAHGDWKTQSARDYFMGMEKNEEGTLLTVFRNFYGIWCRVEREDGELSDIEPQFLEVIETDNISNRIDEFVDKLDTLCFENGMEILPYKGELGENELPHIIIRDTTRGEELKFTCIDGDGRGK